MVRTQHSPKATPNTAGESLEPPSLRSMARSEDAQAVVEMAVLLPVYVAMMIGMVYIGHLVLIRQQVFEAARWYAWSQGGEARGQGNAAFYPRFQKLGRSGVSDFAADDYRWGNDEKAELNRLGSNSKAVAIAMALVNGNGNNLMRSDGATVNKSGTNLEMRQVTVDHVYKFSWIAGPLPATVLQRESHAVMAYVDTSLRRPWFKDTRPGERQNFPPVETYLRNPSNFGISLDQYKSAATSNTNATTNVTTTDEGDPYLGHLTYSISGGQISTNQPQDDARSRNHTHQCMWNTDHSRLKNPRGQPFFRHPLDRN